MGVPAMGPSLCFWLIVDFVEEDDYALNASPV